MDSFLLIVPPGWVEVEDPLTYVNILGPSEFNAAIDNMDWPTLQMAFEETVYLPAGHVLTGVRAVTIPEYRVWVSMAPAA